MSKTLNIEERKPIWIALSNFYLDTELEEYTLKSIAKKIIESPYSLKKVKEINTYELFPVLHYNLLSGAGVWTGFDEDWLINSILNSLSKRNKLKTIFIKAYFQINKRMFTTYWEKLEQVYNTIKQDSKSS
ncbi:hypothetical protein CLV91_0323 [Maribacter vaceletii]|uniref:DUF7079 domain-containing protein n=1 Tax=Maribacter vaceletii TaxID=1206816 RepID=A0A495EBI8_9FLAO|nr:hypothetical protein [Maribacter vaceletii]RKR14248.1 hypothetical protein CLV91_0323 [Maribacter vaceletii]